MIRLGTALLDPARRVLHGPDAAVEVAPHVARLLALLARTPGEVMPYAQVLAACYDGTGCRAGDGGQGALKVQLFRARRALQRAGAGVDIRTIKRVGLSLDAGGDLVVRAYTPEQAAAADAAVAALARGTAA